MAKLLKIIGLSILIAVFLYLMTAFTYGTFNSLVWDMSAKAALSFIFGGAVIITILILYNEK